MDVVEADTCNELDCKFTSAQYKRSSHAAEDGIAISHSHAPELGFGGYARA